MRCRRHTRKKTYGYQDSCKRITFTAILFYMKYTLPVIITALLSASVSFGQPRYSPSERAKRETQWMTDSLKLSPEQSAKVSEINLLYNNRLDKVTIIKNPQASAKKQQRNILLLNRGLESSKAGINMETESRCNQLITACCFKVFFQHSLPFFLFVLYSSMCGFGVVPDLLIVGRV